MKKILFAICITAMVVCISSPALSYSVGLNEVGGVDSLIAWGAVGSGDQDEIDWVNLKLGTSFTTADLTKYPEDDINMSWLATNAAGIYAIDFQTSPEYFFIKTGNISDGIYAGLDHFLYKNENEFAWGVVNLVALGIDVQNIGKISHIGEIGEQVPEPVTLLLLGLGIVGLAGVRKFKK